MRADGSAAKPVLLLAGTAEARAVCEVAAREGLRVLASFAGRTRAPSLPVPTRVGGFGGDAGLRSVLNGVGAVLDATHPFAATMSERAARLSAEAETPYLRLSRPPWPPEPHWRRHPDLEDAARALPPGARVFLATGCGGLAAFENRDLVLHCRRVDPAPPRPGIRWIVGPPGDAESEAALFRRLAITHLVLKNAGGAARGKLVAARALGLAVHVVDRPPSPGGEEIHDIDRALRFLRRHAAPHRDA